MTALIDEQRARLVEVMAAQIDPWPFEPDRPNCYRFTDETRRNTARNRARKAIAAAERAGFRIEGLEDATQR